MARAVRRNRGAPHPPRVFSQPRRWRLSKGSNPRPIVIDRKEFERRWQATFGEPFQRVAWTDESDDGDSRTLYIADYLAGALRIGKKTR